MIIADAPALWLPPKPAIIRPWEKPPVTASLMVNQLIGFGVGGGFGGNDSFTKLLVHCDGADASTTFTDSSSLAHTLTANGNAQVDTAQSKFGGAALLLDGTGDYVSVPSHADLRFGTGDFTIDLWVRRSASQTNKGIIANRSSGTATEWILQWDDDQANQLNWSTGAAYIINNPGSPLNQDQWYHIEVSRSGTTVRMFVDGTQLASATDSNNYTGTSAIWIGGEAYGGGTPTYMTGWIDEVRISKGIARHTANFTPPTGPYDAG